MVAVPNWEALFAMLIPNLVAWACIFPTIGHLSNKDGTAWYQLLKKPTWVLPAFSYGPIFAYMYTSMGYASYLVYLDTAGFKDDNNVFPVVLYVSHLILTFIIANLFYKYHKLAFSFFLTVVLDAILLAVTISFYQINKYSAIFLVPIQAWQFYGTLLSHAFWVLNTKKVEDLQTLKA